MKPEELSRQLRLGKGPFLARRRGIVALSLVTASSMGLITLYQMGIIKHLPEPPLPKMNADEIDAAPEAYARLAMPDAVLGLASYSITMALASMGGEDRAKTLSAVPLALAAKTLVDATQAGILSVDQWTNHRAFCFWCLIAAGATFGTVPLAVPEAWAAFQHLRSQPTLRQQFATAVGLGR